MKVFISSDIEGTTGITTWDETEKNAPSYGYFAAQMTKEVNAVCTGALEAGADAILIKDAHDSARNLDPSALPRQARVLRGWTGDLLCMMSGIDTDSFDAAIMTGYHSAAGCPGNPLSHTNNLKNEWVTLNGQRMSEFTLNALMAGYFHVPVVLVTGDETLCRYAKGWIPGITTVATNRGIGGACLGRHPQEVTEEMRVAARRALTSDFSRCQVPMPEHFKMTIRFREHPVAYSRSFYPGATLSDAKEVSFETDDFMELLRFAHFVL